MGSLRYFFQSQLQNKRSLAFKLAAGAIALAVLALVSACSMNEERKPEGPQSGSSIVLSPDGETLYVANGDSNTISVVNAASRKVTKEIAVGKEPKQLTVSPGGKTLYVTCRYANSVEWVDIESGKFWVR